MCLLAVRLKEDTSYRAVQITGDVLWTISSKSMLNCGRKCTADLQCVAIAFVRTIPECSGFSNVTGSGPTRTGSALYYLQ